MSVKTLCKNRAKKLGVTHLKFDLDTSQIVANAPGGKQFQLVAAGRLVTLPCLRAQSWAEMEAILSNTKVVNVS